MRKAEREIVEWAKEIVGHCADEIAGSASERKMEALARVADTARHLVGIVLERGRYDDRSKALADIVKLAESIEPKKEENVTQDPIVDETAGESPANEIDTDTNV